MRLPLVLVCLVTSSAYCQTGGPTNDSQPGATLQYAPDRTYHLIHASAAFNVDEVHKRATAKIVDTFSILRRGTTKVQFNEAVEKEWDVRIDGKDAHWTQLPGMIEVDVPSGPAGAVHTLSLQVEGRIFNWFSPNKMNPEKIGLWAEGLSALPVAWAAPNDFTSTDISATVPADWGVYSNGLMVSDKPAGTGRHTVSWRMDQPHANYLTSIIAGPYDVRTDSWHGKPLIMTCPKGYGDRLDYTFEHTKDILSYFSNVLGVPYAWPKYGQHIIYDHPYGEEDVNATIYPMFWSNGRQFLSLANKREGQQPFEWVIAHETAHQWFGDLVTCKDWGHTWLNEAFATFMEMMYTEHSRGSLESLREIESYSQRYFAESRRYRRPIVTNYFSNQGDNHTYLKGGSLLMSLRKQLGDEAFFRGINRYVTRHYLANAETNDLIEDMTDATGINLHPWFDQWILKPGHPVLSMSWSYDAGNKRLTLNVSQKQDTSDGTPIYDFSPKVGIISGGTLVRVPIHLNADHNTIPLQVDGPPDAVLLDPDHEFLREIVMPTGAPESQPAVFKLAPNPSDRVIAMSQLLDGNPSSETLRLVAEGLRSDLGAFPALPDTSKLAGLKRKELHAFWVAETTHPNYARRANAAAGLAGVADGAADLATLHKLLGDDQPYVVVAAALRGLAELDFPAIRDVAVGWGRTSPNQDVRAAALEVVAKAGYGSWARAIIDTASDGNPTLVRKAGLDLLKLVPPTEPRLIDCLRSAFQCDEDTIVSSAVHAAGSLKLKALVPDLQALKGTHSGMGGEIDASITAING